MSSPCLSLRTLSRSGKLLSGGYQQYLKFLISGLSDVMLVKFLRKGGAGL